MPSRSDSPSGNSAFDNGNANAVLTRSEAASDSTDTDFLQGYISEPDYARRRGVTLRTCQRDRQLRKAPPYTKLGRQVFYRVDALREWMTKNERVTDQIPHAPRYRSPFSAKPSPRGRATSNRSV